MSLIVNNCVYEFVPLVNTSKALNMWGSSADKNINVNLYAVDHSNTQRWRAVRYSEANDTWFLHCMANEAYVLDRYRGSSALNNADIYTKATNDTDRADQLVKFTLCGTYGSYQVYYIDLASDGKRLSAVDGNNGNDTGKTSTSTGNVYFGGGTTNKQKWVAIPVNGSGSSKYVGILERRTTCPSGSGHIEVDGVPNTSGYEDNCWFFPDCGFADGSHFSSVSGVLLDQLRTFSEKVFGYVVQDNLLSYYLFGEAENSGVAKYHPGVDIQRAEGAEVRTIYAGEVVFSDKGRTEANGSNGAVGIYVAELGITTYYLHMKNITVNSGDVVSVNQKIGEQSSVGKYAAGSHLHFEVWNGRRSSGPSGVYNYVQTIMPYGYMDGVIV